MQFVTKMGWDEKKHGEWDPSKVVKQELFGEEKEGIWVKTQPDGVFEYEAYDDRSFTESQLHHDSKEGPFGEEALQRKRKVTSEAFQAASKARSSSAVQGQELSLQDLLARIGSGAASSGMDSKDAATGQGSGDEKASEASGQADGTESESSTEEDLLGVSFWGSAAKSKAKPAAKAGSSAAPSAKASGAKEVRQPQTKAATRNKLQGKAASAAEPPKTSEKSKQKKEKAADEPPPVMPYGMVPYTESPAGMQLWPVVC